MSPKDLESQVRGLKTNKYFPNARSGFLNNSSNTSLLGPTFFDTVFLGLFHLAFMNWEM